MQETVKKEYDKIRLINILSKAEKPIKAKELGELCCYMQEFRNAKEFCICSKPGPQGGYFISSEAKDINLCETWINNWRHSMGIPKDYAIA